MIQIDLSGKVALVTGAGQGLGEATARTLHAAGATLALNDLADAGSESSARLDQLAADLGERVACFPADVRDLAAVDRTAFAASRLYLQVNTRANPDGEIRVPVRGGAR